MKQFSLLSSTVFLFFLVSCANESDYSIEHENISHSEESKEPINNLSKEDKIICQKLTKYLGERNLDFCSFSDEIEKMEIECIHKADAIYPDFGIKHNEYVEELTTSEIKKLGQKHNIADSIFPLIAILGVRYCK